MRQSKKDKYTRELVENAILRKEKDLANLLVNSDGRSLDSLNNKSTWEQVGALAVLREVLF